jgi:hypothetical protein
MAAPLLPWVPEQFFTPTGEPADGYQVFFYTAGTSTKQDTFNDSDLVTPNPNPIVLDSDGRSADPIFLSPIGYKVVFTTPTDTDPPVSPVWTVDNVSDPGYIYSQLYGTLQVTNTVALNQTSGYVVLSTDTFVTMNGGATPTLVYLPAAADYGGKILTIKNMAAIALSITPDGSDTIEGLAAAYSVAASASPLFRTVNLASDGVSAWWVLNGIGV